MCTAAGPRMKWLPYNYRAPLIVAQSLHHRAHATHQLQHKMANKTNGRQRIPPKV